jgi:HD domain
MSEGSRGEGYYDIQVRGETRLVVAPALATMGEPFHDSKYRAFETVGPGRRMMMGDDPRLPKMPERPTLLDFFRYRLAKPAVNHLLQSAALAQRSGQPEKIVLACLLHDIAVGGLFSGDHGYWGAQLVAPYVEEEVAWAIREHQALRFFADESVGYGYPVAYTNFFGPEYVPPPYIHEAYKAARAHRWYMTSRLITMNDLYAFDPNTTVAMEEFTDIIGRNFRQPAEGLGFDGSPVAHMWRAMVWPHNAL